MKILKIKLNNIGPYKGENNIFDLGVSKGKNIILIGGKNGAGKTTLLNSIKIGLFGTYAYGLKTASNVYYDALKKIFNYVESKKKISNYEISIEFSLIENYIENKYTFSRSWKKVGKEITEILRVKRNETYLLNDESEQIQTKLKEIMPPSVIDTMLFDGEKIAQIIDDHTIPDYLKEIIYVNFNINIFDKMEDDINFYIEKEKSKNSFNAEQINLLEYKNKYNKNLKNHKNLKDIKEKYIKTLEENKFKLKGLIKKFDNYGGLTDKERFAMRSSLEILESSRKENLAKIKEFLEDDFVFYLNKDRIQRINESIEIEKPLILLKYVDEIEKFLGTSYVKKIKEKINERLDNNLRIRYNPTPKLSNLVNTILQRIEETPVETIKFILKNSREDLNNTKVYKKIIGNNENANSIDLQGLLKSIKEFEIENEEIKEKIKELEKDIRKSEVELNASLIELETIEKKIDSERKEENSFYIARKMLKVSNEYKEKQIKNYLLKISDLSVKKFDEINKKENYVSKMIINPEDYNITLFDNNNIEKDITMLSAGEKQLLISAIIWSIFKLSDRNNMFTFDTPLARLDKANRELFVEKVLCTISDQVLILSTDEEIVGNLYKIVKKNVSKKYILENNDKEGKTEVKEDYF